MVSAFILIAGFLCFIHILQTLFAKYKKIQLPPGPPGLPILGHLHLLGDLPHRSLHKLSQKYGPIMQLRLGLIPTIVVSSPEWAELLLKTHDTTFASRPKIEASEYLAYGSKGVGFAEYGSYWRNLRKLCAVHLLNNHKIDSFRPLRKEETASFIRSIKEAGKGQQVVNISSKIGLVVESTIYRMICGGSSGDNNTLNLKASVEEAMRLSGVFNLTDFVPLMKVFDLQGITHRLKKVSKTVDDFLEKVINDHEENSVSEHESQRDFIHVMLSLMKTSNLREETLDRTNIKAIIIDMLAASMDTTATTIEWAVTELLRHPQVMKQVQEELVTMIGLDRMVEESDLVNLPYLNNVVKETLRLHPAAPLLVPHESINDISIGGYFIPRKSRVIINAWAIGRDPSAWCEKPEEFYPDRFMNKDVDVRGNDMQLLPFGSGRRKCPGIELGLKTVHFILAQLVHCFNLELPEGNLPRDIDMKEKFGLTVQKANSLSVVPTYRLYY